MGARMSQRVMKPSLSSPVVFSLPGWGAWANTKLAASAKAIPRTVHLQRISCLREVTASGQRIKIRIGFLPLYSIPKHPSGCEQFEATQPFAGDHGKRSA